MKYLKIILLLSLFSSITAFTVHKFYVSTTNVEYVKEKQSIQIISKIFIDDVEDVLQKRYGDQVSLATKKETKKDEEFLEKYLLDKLKIKVNGKEANLKYIGREYETDVVKMYFEITGVASLQKLEIENKALMDLFAEQQNIIHIKTPLKRRSLVLEADNPKGMLNFK